MSVVRPDDVRILMWAYMIMVAMADNGYFVVVGQDGDQ